MELLISEAAVVLWLGQIRSDIQNSVHYNIGRLIWALVQCMATETVYLGEEGELEVSPPLARGGHKVPGYLDKCFCIETCIYNTE